MDISYYQINYGHNLALNFKDTAYPECQMPVDKNKVNLTTRNGAKHKVEVTVNLWFLMKQEFV